MPATQNFKNHAATDPFFGAFALIFLTNFFLSIYITIRDWPKHSRSHLWWIVISIGLILLAQRIRAYGTKNQDRIIRLEERFRYAALLPTAELSRAAALTLPQIIALRFASDAELPGLIERTLRENLTPKQIKQSVTDWQPDFHRV